MKNWFNGMAIALIIILLYPVSNFFLHKMQSDKKCLNYQEITISKLDKIIELLESR